MPQRTTAERYREKMDLLATEAKAWESIHAGVTEKVRFLLDGQHYADDSTTAEEKDSSEIRWVGEEGFDRYRHELAKVTEQGSLTARPVDQYGDADLGELAVKLINSDIENPAKEFEDHWEDVVGAAIAGGYGVAWLDFLPREGPWGEIIFTSDDPRNFMCDRRVKSIHDYRCRFIIRRVRMTIGEAKRRCTKDGKGWNRAMVNRLQPDNGHNADELVRLSTAKPRPEDEPGDASNDAPDDRKEFTAYFIWQRHADNETETQKDYNEYDPQDRYMRCESCAYRSETQGVLQAKGQLEGDLPESLDGGCPECLDSQDVTRLGDMHRVDGDEQAIEMLAYPDGYLCVLAPYALPGVEGGFLYEDKWPYKLRSYPATFLPRFRHPFRIVGPAVTDLIWWNQTATDMMMRLVLERMVQTAPFTLLPEDGLFDARGARFELSDENGWKAYYRGDQPPAVRTEGGDPGIPAAWNPIYQAARNALTAHSGRADFGLSDTQSRDIPASSVALQVRQEEIPVEHFKKRYQRQRGIIIGVYYDMMRAVYPAERLHRLFGPDAEEMVRALAASDMPNFDFVFDTTPDIKPAEQAQAAALDLLLNTMETRPWAVELVQQAHHISPSMVRKAQQRFRDYQQQIAAAQAQTIPGAGAQPLGPGGPQQVQESPSAMVERLMAGMAPQQTAVGG